MLIQLTRVESLSIRPRPKRIVELVNLERQLANYVNRNHSHHYYHDCVRLLQPVHRCFLVLSYVLPVLVPHILFPTLVWVWVGLRLRFWLFVKTWKVSIVRIRSRLPIRILTVEWRLISRLIRSPLIRFLTVPIRMLRVVKLVLFFLTLTRIIILIVLSPLHK